MLFFIILERLIFRNTNKMGRRSTALPPEKSKSLRVLCGNVWDINSFCICTPPCTLSSVSFLCRTPGRESCRLPVCKAEYRCCGSPALVRQQFIAIGRRLPFFQQLFEQGQQPVEIRVERLYPLVVLFSDFITHMRLILVIHYS